MRADERETTEILTKSFKQRTTAPGAGNPYYTRRGSGGYSNCIQGNTANIYPLSWAGCVLPNCVGYACGRFNEIEGADINAAFWGIHGNAKTFADSARKIGYSVGFNPMPGAIMVWGNSSCGHVAIVEEVVSNDEVIISQSGWSSKKLFWRATRRRGSDGLWCDGENWAKGRYSDFRGFVYCKSFACNDYSEYDYYTPVPSDYIVVGNSTYPQASGYTVSDKAKKKTREEVALEEHNTKVLEQYNTVVAKNYLTSKGADLLTSSSLVETPFIIVKIGDYTFGSYTKSGTLERASSMSYVNYPNYMQSISINKTNGVLNVYTIEMIYQITPGDDPNLIDRVLSTVSDSRIIKISYGDWSAPAFIFKEEEAIITKVTSHVDFSNQSISYTLSCTSKSLSAAAQTYHFEKTNAKASDVVKKLISSDTWGLKSAFPGMTDSLSSENLIPGDDKVVEIEAQDMTPIEYLNYVVSCMSSSTNSGSDVIKDSTYHISFNDDVNGASFKITKVNTSSKAVTSSDVYEIDIGTTVSTLVTNFDITTDNSWSILYKNDQKVDLNTYVYRVGDDGIVYSDYVDSRTAVSTYYRRVTEIDKTWWTRMTQFPVSATLTIKGLLRPAILMTYLRINTYFYGQKHISSGLYIITKQEDKIDENGYRTTLSLTRISGDEDETQNYSQNSVVSGVVF